MSRWDRIAAALRAEMPDAVPADRLSAIAELSHAEVVEVVALRAGGKGAGAITPAVRDELLAKLQKGEYVELELDVIAYEQQPGKRNRQFVRVRDGAMLSFGRSGRGKPFLRDHEMRNSLARGGTVLDSYAEKRGEGDYAVHQTIKITEPWAVGMALRGNLDSLSVGINPAGGEVMCSLCGTAVFEDCFHFRGQEVQLESGETVVIEWVYEKPEIDETSGVTLGAVAAARVQSIRAALSGWNSGLRATSAHERDTNMKLLGALVALLSLAPTAGEDEAIEAVKAMKSDRDRFEAQLGVSETERVRLSGVVEAHRQTERELAANEFIKAALSSGRIAAADESVWRKLYAVDAKAAQEDMAKRPVGLATPVGLPRQTPTNDPTPSPAVEDAKKAQAPTEVKAALTAAGADADLTIRLAGAFGVKDPKKSIPQALGLNTEV